MKARTHKLLAVICSSISLILVFVASYTFTAQQVPISKLSLADEGRFVTVCGTLEKFKTSNNHIFLTLSDTSGSIPVVIFNTTALKLNKTQGIYSLRVGQQFCSAGRLQEYPQNSGKLEIIHGG